MTEKPKVMECCSKTDLGMIFGRVSGGVNMQKVMECCSKTDLDIIFGRLAGGVNMPKVMECCSKTSFPGTRKTVNTVNMVNTVVLK